MKSKKTVAKMLLVAFVFSLVLPASVFAADTKIASDLNGHWAQATIQQWMSKGLIGGYEDGTFQPDRAITRAEFIKLVNKAIGANKAGVVNFTDVSADDWFYGELQLAMGAGYVGGFEDGTFRPNDTVTRAQAAAFIAKAKNLANDPAAAARFVDNSAIADWAKGAVGAAAKAGYIGGYQDGTFQPDKALTRAEAVSMLDRVLSQADKAKDDKKPVAGGGGSSSSSGGSSGGGGNGGGGGGNSDKNDINTAQISYDASEKALIVKANGTVTPSSINAVTINSLTIGENVTEATIKGFEVNGTTNIKGGSSNSIHFNMCQLNGQVLLNKKDVHVVLENTTKINGSIIVNQAASLSPVYSDSVHIYQPIEVKADLTIKSGYVPKINVVAEATVKAESGVYPIDVITVDTTAPVTIAAPAEKVIVAQASEKVALESTVAAVDVNAANAVVSVAANVENVNVNAPATIEIANATIDSIASTVTGEGTVQVTGTGTVNKIVAKDPAAVEVAETVDAPEVEILVEAEVEAADGLTYADNKVSGTFTGTLNEELFGTASKDADLGQIIVKFTGLKDDQDYTIKQTNHALLAAYPEDQNFTDNVKEASGYAATDLADGLYVLVLQGDKNDITIELSETNGDVVKTVTIGNATTATEAETPAEVEAVVEAADGLAYADNKVSGTFTGTLNEELFGTASKDADLGQIVVKFTGLKEDQDYTIKQTNHALFAAYPEDQNFTDNVKEASGYAAADLAEGLYVLVLQGDENDIIIELSETRGDVVKTVTIGNATTATGEVVVPPTIEVGEVSGTVTAQDALVASDDNGKITAAEFSTEGLPFIDVSLKKGTLDYDAVRITGGITTGEAGNIQLIAQSGSDFYDTMKAGWGVSTGFPLQEDATTRVYIVSNQADTYTGKIKLVNVANNDEVIGEQDITITVENQLEIE